MPDEETTEETTVETVEPEAPAAYVFPFDIPQDLAAADEETLRGLHTQIREHGQSLAGTSPADTSEDVLLGLRACRDLAVQVSDELIGRQDAAAQQAEREAEAAELAAELAGHALPEPPAAPEPAAVTASTRRTAPPSARQVAATRRSPALTANDIVPQARGSITASADVGRFSTGQQLEKFADIGEVLAARLDKYPVQTASRSRKDGTGGKRPITVWDPNSPGRQLSLKNYTRHSGVQIHREYPDDLRIGEVAGDRAWETIRHAASESRLPGGSLVESAKLAVGRGGRKSLTAAAGWCAPSDIMYDLLELETLEGILDAPEVATPRGGWQIPVDGGPDFTSIWDALGSSGDTHLTEAEVIADTAKVCTEIVCPDFEEIRLGVDYFCLTGSLLQRRGYPEAVARFARGAVIALAHKINRGFIADLVAGSDSVILGADPSGDDAASALLSGVELAVVDIRYRHRLAFNATVEAVFPFWVMQKVRAGLSRRTGVALLNVSDAMILGWFADRGIMPRFVYDWQDAFSSGPTGSPGASTPITALPTNVQVLIYPAGTWVKATQDVVELDTIYDSTLLETNQYTAVFSETGWAALKMGPVSRVYTIPVDPSGVTGCCPAEEIS